MKLDEKDKIDNDKKLDYYNKHLSTVESEVKNSIGYWKVLRKLLRKSQNKWSIIDTVRCNWHWLIYLKWK